MASPFSTESSTWTLCIGARADGYGEVVEEKRRLRRRSMLMALKRRMSGRRVGMMMPFSM